MDKVSKYALLIGISIFVLYVVWNIAVWGVSVSNGLVSLHERVSSIEKRLSLPSKGD